MTPPMPAFRYPPELPVSRRRDEIVAAIRRHPSVSKGQRVGVIITGGNVDVDKLPWI